MTSKPLSDEEVRILRAVADRRMRMNDASRYVIEGGGRPERKARERLMKRGLIDAPWRGPVQITTEGRAYLSSLDVGQPS